MSTKRVILTFVAMLCVGVLSAQEPYKVFCAISGTSYSNKFTNRIKLDYGQENTSHSWLVDEQGKELKLKSVSAVANYLAKRGWEFEDSSTWGEEGGRMVWIMSKMVTDDSQITEGFTTAQMYQDRKRASDN